MNKLETLKHYFGHDTFRPLQEEVVDAIVNKEDVLMILPTGGGKSLCYQLPTLLMDGITIVVSPLLALMHDQVVALRANDIPAAMLSSMQDLDEAQKIEAQLHAGEIKLLYSDSTTPSQSNWYRLDVYDSNGAMLAITNPIFVGRRKHPQIQTYGEVLKLAFPKDDP